MNNQDLKIHIIGSGISGLIAAKVLEDNGFAPVIIEATERAGGRVKTDIINGYQLDHGFQVLLTAYPAAKKYLDYDALELQKFLPGAAIFRSGKQAIIGDALRNFSLLIPTLFSGVGTFADKLKVLKLNNKLKNKSLSQIFSDKEQTTFSYLTDFGFSSQMINQFFRPFFSGIFLEDKLDTSSRMFEFVYKMFGEGHASLPKSGIEAIPRQLVDSLTKTNFQFNTSVASVKEGAIVLSNGQTLQSDFTIIATDASKLIQNTDIKSTNWKSCTTLYFEADRRIISKPLIGLIADSDTLINNIFYHTSLKTDEKPKKELLSVTVVKDHKLKDEDLVKEVQRELEHYCGIEATSFIKQYTIPLALPNLSDLKYEMLPSETCWRPGIFLAGDLYLNGSLNAAMISGERAALGVIEAISQKVSQ